MIARPITAGLCRVAVRSSNVKCCSEDGGHGDAERGEHPAGEHIAGIVDAEIAPGDAHEKAESDDEHTERETEQRTGRERDAQRGRGMAGREAEAVGCVNQRSDTDGKSWPRSRDRALAESTRRARSVAPADHHSRDRSWEEPAYDVGGPGRKSVLQDRFCVITVLL